MEKEIENKRARATEEGRVRGVALDRPLSSRDAEAVPVGGPVGNLISRLFIWTWGTARHRGHSTEYSVIRLLPKLSLSLSPLSIYMYVFYTRGSRKAATTMGSIV